MGKQRGNHRCKRSTTSHQILGSILNLYRNYRSESEVEVVGSPWAGRTVSTTAEAKVDCSIELPCSNSYAKFHLWEYITESSVLDALILPFTKSIFPLPLRKWSVTLTTQGSFDD